MIPVVLTLPELPPRTIVVLETDDPWEAASIVSRRYPFLPPAYVWLGDRALAGLLGADRATPARVSDPEAPSREPTAGQKAWRERVQRARRAERWRQHWIAKDEAKRSSR